MGYLDTFNAVVGETLMYCQRIEHDIKVIYAAMLKGEMDGNLDLVRRETLGTVLVALENLDFSDNNPMFSREDYRLLKEIKNIKYKDHANEITFKDNNNILKLYCENLKDELCQR